MDNSLKTTKGDGQQASTEIQFVNLTRETIRLGSPAVIIPPSGQQAKVVFDRRIADRVQLPQGTVPVFEIRTRGRVMGLPAPRPGTMYIVPAMLRNYLTNIGEKREDVVSPWAQGIKGGKRWASALAR